MKTTCLLLVLSVACLSARLVDLDSLIGHTTDSHYDMGPAHRYSPEHQPFPSAIRFSNGFGIDTRAGTDNLPARLRIDERPVGAACYIVQFAQQGIQAGIRVLKENGVREVFGYLPENAVLAVMSRADDERVAGLSEVNWVGLYQPGYKLARGLLEAAGSVKVTALMLPGRTEQSLLSFALYNCADVHDVQRTRFGTSVTLTIDAELLADLARLDDVMWIQKTVELTFANDNCQWVVQTGWRATAPPPDDTLARWVWTRGVRGQGIVLSTTDTGLNLDHDMFRDPTLPVTAPGIWPEHRKVVAFKLYDSADGVEGYYHGSHVNGTVAGNDSVTGGSSYYDGMAPEARLYFVDVSKGMSRVTPSDLTSVWDTVYLGRGLPDSVRPIRQHSGSWGHIYEGDYVLEDATTDAYCWEHPDFLQIFAAGNSGPDPGRLHSPGCAKNVLTVGATENGTGCNLLTDFSSRGPTVDGRIKPTVLAPGRWLYSAQSSGRSGYSQGYGTSMSTPAVNGAVGLMRCYLREGYYPTGEAVAENRFDYISAALLRSMAVVSADPDLSGYNVPSFDIGWGRIDVSSVLYFPGEQQKLWLADDTSGLGLWEYKDAWLSVSSPGPLRVCLAWTDTAATLSVNPTIVNDLDLELTAPDGTVYRGNQYSGGQSEPNPSERDSLNTEECCRVNSPQPGSWRVRVSAPAVMTEARQDFALAVTGTITGAGTQETEEPSPAGQDKAVGSLVRGVLICHGTGTALLLDVSGRRVLNLKPGPNDVRQLPPGVYFVRSELSAVSREPSAVPKVIISR